MKPLSLSKPLCVMILAALVCRADAQPAKPGPGVTATVEIEEVVTRYAPANNGASPLWCYGAPLIARQGGEVFLSVLETGQDIPPLVNTRWQLWHRTADRWHCEQHESDYRQREPCPLVLFPDGPVFLSVTPCAAPAGGTQSRSTPALLEFDPRHPTQAPKTHEPVWSESPYFTEHSYRGLAADGVNHELLLLNINARTGAQYVSYRDRTGHWSARGKIDFPVRACYPQVALRDRAAHVLAIGDIVEPVEAWKKLKYEKYQRDWDYVFRRLFYTYSPDIRTAGFAEPIEIDTVEATCGHISNLDLYVDPVGTAHLLYLKTPHQHAFIRDKYFPGQPITSHLEYVTVRDGQVTSRRTLAEKGGETTGVRPSYARFHIDPDGAIYIVLSGADPEGEDKTFGNFIGRITDGAERPVFRRLAMDYPFRTFFTNTPRGGSAPSDIIDLFGTAQDSPNLRYARIRLQ